VPGFFVRLLINALGIWLASEIVPGIHVDGTGTLLAAALLLGIVNALVRPIAIVLTLPITILSLGLFLWAINAAMIALVAVLVDGFHVTSFGAALVAAAIVSVTGWIGSSFVGPKGRFEVMTTRSSSRSRQLRG
jgi:putative membrane protein